MYPALMEPVEQSSRSMLNGMQWVVRVGWLQGKVDRGCMKEWCMESIERKDEARWMHDKGGNWYFRYEEDATMFLLAWG